MEYVDLVLDNGDLVRIECPSKFCDDLYDSLENAMKCEDFWSPGRFDGCTAQYRGHLLSRVAMRKVVAYL